MSKRWFFILICASAILSIFYSCSKSGDSPAIPQTHSVTYKLSANNYTIFSSVTYNDSTGAPVSVSAVDSTAGWSKAITVSFSPYTSHLEVQGINSSTNTVTYKLSIYVDGIMKATQQDSVAKFNSFNTQASAVIQ